MERGCVEFCVSKGTSDRDLFAAAFGVLQRVADALGRAQPLVIITADELDNLAAAAVTAGASSTRDLMFLLPTRRCSSAR
jgi:hypothetical protein